MIITKNQIAKNTNVTCVDLKQIAMVVINYILHGVKKLIALTVKIISVDNVF